MFKRSVSDNHNGNRDDLVIYFNILLNNKATLYYGKHYTLIDIMEQQGGLTQCLMIIILLFSRPFLFKRHEITIFCDHENQFEAEQTTDEKSYVRKIQDSIIPIEMRVFFYYIYRYFGALCCCKKRIFSEQDDNDIRKMKVENMGDVVEKMQYIVDYIYDKQSFVKLHEITDTKEKISELDKKLEDYITKLKGEINAKLT